MQHASIAVIEQRIAALDGQSASLEVEIDALQRAVSQHRVVAPTDGTVGWLAPVTTGSVVATGAPLATVVPSGVLLVEARFTPELAARLAAGQSATLRVDGYAWTVFGAVPATVLSVGTEERDGTVSAKLSADPSATDIPMQHGLAGAVLVEIERVSPASLTARALGRG